MKKIIKIVLPVIAGAGIYANAGAENVLLHTPESFQVLSLSPNGNWACGVYVDAVQEMYAFRWNLLSGSIEMLGQYQSVGWDVSNDGTVSGECNDPRALPNGAPVAMPGYWRDGEWHYLEMPKGRLIDGIGGCITPDGHYMTGSISVDGRYRPYIWKDGAIHRVLDTGKDAVSYAVSPDGQAAAGFSTQYNRTACFWQPGGDLMYFMDTDYSQGPWSYARNFSPDGTKLLYWGGWEVVDEETLYLYSMYDITTGEKTKIKMLSMQSDGEFFDVSNLGTLVGSDLSRGFIAVNGEAMYIDDYLKSKGIDISDFDDFYSAGDYYENQLPIFRVVSISEDDSVLAMNYYNTRGQMSSLVLKVNPDFGKVTPVEISAGQLAGLQTVALNWKRPVGANTIKGYNVYRDGKKLNGFLPINNLYYYDSNLQPGVYEYEISAVTVSGTETRSEAHTVEVKAPAKEAPYALFGRQKGINSAYLTWTSPMSNVAHKRYYDADRVDMTGFSIYVPVDVEMAVRYDHSEMAAYKGYKISEVSFCPMAEQNGWAVNIYSMENDTPMLVYTQPITQELQYKSLNVVTLDTPVDLPQHDLVVAIECKATGINQEVIGAQHGHVIAGYTDLLRQKTEDTFMSAYESSTAAGYTVTCMTWAIDFGLTNDATADNQALDSYNIYCGDELVGSTTETNFVVNALADGEHQFSVEAVYADGSVSETINNTLTIAGNYPAITEVAVDPGEEGSTVVTATWNAPVENDQKDITYTTASKPVSGIIGNESYGYAMTVGAEYPARMFRGYEGYKIKSFRFYPMADALFTFLLYADGELVYDLEVEDFEIGKWNEIELPDEFIVNENVTYRLAVDCFDPEPDKAVMGIDNQAPFVDYSDLYTQDGDTWSSLCTETGSYGSWLIGMVITDGEAIDVDVDGYDVSIDGKVCNAERITETTYTYDLGKNDDKRHSIMVDVYYPSRSEVVKGDKTYFYMSVAGIRDNMIANVKLNRGENYLIAEGDGVESLQVYATNGTLLTSAKGDRVNISSLNTGIYLVKITVDGKMITRKVNILKNK